MRDYYLFNFQLVEYKITTITTTTARAHPYQYYGVWSDAM